MNLKHQYKVDIRWSDEDHAYIARVPELSGVVTHGTTVSEAAKMAEEAIELHLETLEKYKIEPPKPISTEHLSGNYQLRIGKELHEDAVLKQRSEGYKSFNEYLKHLVEVDVALVTIPRKQIIEMFKSYIKNKHKSVTVEDDDLAPMFMKQITRESFFKGSAHKKKSAARTTKKASRTKRSSK